MSGDRQDMDLRRWLAGSRGRRFLEIAAQKVFRKAGLSNLSPAFFQLGPWADLPSGISLMEIENQIALYLLENPEIQNKLGDAISGKTDADKTILPYLVRSFLNRWRESTRRQELDPWRYLYKRAAAVLRKSERFFPGPSDRKSTSFSMVAENVLIGPLAEEDLEGIPFPESSVSSADFSSINRKVVLLEIAELFWNRVSQLHGGKPVWVDLRDFIQWIGMRVQLRGPALKPSSREVGESPDDPIQSEIDNESLSNLLFDPEEVVHHAKIAVGRLKDREKAVFYFRYGAGLDYAEISRRMGYAGPSGAVYPERQALMTLKNFLRDLRWLSPEDLNEEAFSLFRETLLSILKKSISDP